MKMKKISLFALLLAGMFAFVSCEKDDSKNLSKDEAQQQIANVEQDLVTKSNEIVATDGYKIQDYYYGLPSPFVSKSNPVKAQGSSMAQRVMELASRNLMLQNPEIDFHIEYFIIDYFNDVKGTWSWTPNGWSHETTPTDKVVVKFPYPQTNATNNVTITYYDFTTTLVYGVSEPTGIKVKIEDNGTQVFTLAYSATITNMMKYSTKVDVTFGTFSISAQESMDASVNNKMLMGKSFVFKKDGKTFYSENADVSVTFLENNTADILMNAKQVIGNLEFRIKLDANTSAFETGNPNDIISLSLYTTSGDKVGDFVFVQEGEDWELYFKFNNGEQVKAETLMPNISMRVLSFIEDVSSSIFV